MAGREKTPPELAEFQNENEKVNENEYLLVTSSPHPFPPFLLPYATHAKAVPLIEAEAVYTRKVKVQSAAPSIARTVINITPPVSGDA